MSKARDNAIMILRGLRVTARTIGAVSGDKAEMGAGIVDKALGFVIRLLKKQTPEEALATLRRVAEEGEGPITDAELEADLQSVLDELKGAR